MCSQRDRRSLMSEIVWYFDRITDRVIYHKLITNDLFTYVLTSYYIKVRVRSVIRLGRFRILRALWDRQIYTVRHISLSL